MSIYFKTNIEARNYILNQSKGFQQIEPEVQRILDPEILFQEHFSFNDIKAAIRHRFSLIERHDGFEVKHDKKLLSKLVLACEYGDLELFNEAIKNPNSNNTLALAFVTAIHSDNLVIVKRFILNELVPNDYLYKNPIETATTFDSIKSFKYLISVFKMPENILAHILRNDAIGILNYIISDKKISSKILTKQNHNTDWVQRLLTKPQYFNNIISTYKNLIIK